MSSALKSIVAAQNAWARDRVLTDRGCNVSLDDNLFQRPMNAETLAEFRAGAGDETGFSGTQSKRAKMLSLRSSSVLAVNVFDYWRHRDLRALASALGYTCEFVSLEFERPFAHGLSSAKPHLDVVVHAAGGPPLAIESKFTEPYSVAPQFRSAPLAAKYMDRKRWADVRLPACQRIAEQLGHDLTSHRLDAGQLLKHALGLANDPAGHGPDGEMNLFYIWFDTGCGEAEEHRSELLSFAASVDGHLGFRHSTYQDLFRNLSSVASGDYVNYLRERYFPSATIVH